MFKLSKEFFALPLEEKMKLDKCIPPLAPQTYRLN
jgi:isopenicillin N synthase-like dioxygenase